MRTFVKTIQGFQSIEVSAVVKLLRPEFQQSVDHFFNKVIRIIVQSYAMPTFVETIQGFQNNKVNAVVKIAETGVPTIG